MFRQIGRLLLWLCHFAGITKLWRWKNRHKILVLAMHGVMSEEVDDRWCPIRWQLRPSLLRKYLKILSKRYEFVTVEEAVSMLSGETELRANCAVFTIDDGYRNALTQAWPILEEFGVTPVVFIATGMIGSETPYWFDRLDLALQSGASHGDEIRLGSQTIVVDKSSSEALEFTCRQLINASRSAYSDEQERLAAIDGVVMKLESQHKRLNRMGEVTDPWIGLMSLEDVQKCADAGIAIGSHTVRHYRIPFLSEDKVRRELRESKAYIERVTGKKCRFFCYPEGSFDLNTANEVAAAGYVAAFSSEQTLNDRSGSLFTLGRIHLPRNANGAEVLAIMCGLKSAIIGTVNRITAGIRGTEV